MLLVDLGNTRGKLVAVQDDKLQPAVIWDYQQSVLPILTELKPSSIAVASVAPEQVLQKLLTAAQKLGAPLLRIETQRKAGGITNAYKEYQRLGVDRWLAMIGARQFTQQACIVVDAGTAVTVDALDGNGQHLGGWILPGLELMQQSLVSRSGALQVAEPPESKGFGTSTSDAIQLGACYAVIGAIEQARQLLVAQSQGSVPDIFITGGDAETLLAFIEVKAEHVADLVFRGLLHLTRSENLSE